MSTICCIVTVGANGIELLVGANIGTGDTCTIGKLEDDEQSEALDGPTGVDTVGMLDEDELEDEEPDPNDDSIVCTVFMCVMTIAWNRSNCACDFFWSAVMESKVTEDDAVSSNGADKGLDGRLGKYELNLRMPDSVRNSSSFNSANGSMNCWEPKSGESSSPFKCWHKTSLFWIL